MEKTKNQKKQTKTTIAHPKGRGSDAECWVLSFFFVFLKNKIAHPKGRGSDAELFFCFFGFLFFWFVCG